MKNQNQPVRERVENRNNEYKAKNVNVKAQNKKPKNGNRKNKKQNQDATAQNKKTNQRHAKSASSFPKGQAALESLLLLGGFLAFWLAWSAGVAPTENRVKAESLERLERAAFERVTYALKTADRLGEGTELEETVSVPVLTRVTLGDAISWSFGNTTWTENAPAQGPDANLSGRTKIHVTNQNGVRVAWH